ncbi:MAG: DNA mismatch repair endonuclease MutL [Clostridia bacterium]|nr:DNA mismatch repair endonuclease MutL [Clostridia bacterium]
MNIQVMPKHMADLIAAGEVVERPASVIKELAENSIDAGATALTIEIKGGGSAYMRVSDNGSGILKEDLPLAFRTHATSKIRSEEDLEHIATLGFRGEALASICAVSRVEVLTLAEGETVGSLYRISGGEEQAFESAGCPKGTTIIVRDLFYNTPARMKFLKRDVTEGNYVAAVVDRIALSHPEVKITFIKEGKQVYATNGDGVLYNAIYAVFGGPFAKSLMPISYELGGVKVSGFISKPLECRANRSMQYFFISGRQVKSVTAMSALENAYKNSIMVGKVPACVMHIDLPAEAVDVNVHPAKIEVRFANEKAVFDAVYYACKNALMEKDTPKEVTFEKKDFIKKQPQPQQQPLAAVPAAHSKPKEDFWQQKSVAQYTKEAEETPQKPAPVSVKAEPETADTAALQTAAAEPVEYHPKRVNIDIDFDETPASEPPVSVAEQEMSQAAESEVESAAAQQPQVEATVEPFEVIGEVFKTYIIVQQGNEVLFIDKHAAHERMLFEQLKADAHADPQMLMEPMNVVLSKEDYDAVITNAQLLEKSGFIVEDFGAGTCIVRAYPMVLENADIKEVLEETAGYLRQHKKDFESEALDWLYHNVACRAAIKAGNFTSRFEMERFVEKLLSMPDIRYCPHGRPVMVVMSKYAFEKQFGRV